MFLFRLHFNLDTYIERPIKSKIPAIATNVAVSVQNAASSMKRKSKCLDSKVLASRDLTRQPLVITVVTTTLKP